jgi:hypothetical protein
MGVGRISITVPPKLSIVLCRLLGALAPGPPSVYEAAPRLPAEDGGV